MPIPVGPPPSKLVVVDLEKGSGLPAKDGDELSVRYFNLAYKGHRIYEDNWRRPYGPFVLGEGQLVEAWEEGLPGIKKGGRRELVVPAGRTTLENKPEIYVVEALSVVRPRQSASAGPVGSVDRVRPTGAKPRIRADLGKPPAKLVVRELKKGTGSQVRRGDQIGARFIDFNYTTKRVQDFWGHEPGVPAPYRFALGEGEVRPGWETVLPGKRLGARLELLLPSRLAYGDGPMRYVVELIEREKPTSDRRG